MNEQISEIKKLFCYFFCLLNLNSLYFHSMIRQENSHLNNAIQVDKYKQNEQVNGQQVENKAFSVRGVLH